MEREPSPCYFSNDVECSEECIVHPVSRTYHELYNLPYDLTFERVQSIWSALSPEYQEIMKQQLENRHPNLVDRCLYKRGATKDCC